MSQSHQSQSEAAIRRAGAVVAIAAASALMAMGFPAVVARAHVVLALHAILLLGCAAVLLSPAHGAVTDLARRATEDARGTTLGVPAGLLRWLGFAGIVLYVTGDFAARKEAAPWPDTVRGFLLFLMFLVGIWAVYRATAGNGGGGAGGVAVAATEEDPDGGEVNAVAPAHVVVDRKL